MKNLLFGLIATVFMSTISSAQTFEQNCVILTGQRVTPPNNLVKSARTIKMINFNASNYRLLNSYVLQGYTYTDDGKNNDVRSGDGIYTSVELFENLKSSKQFAFAAKEFLYTSELVSKISIGISCKINITYSGTSLLGFSCATGCIYFTDCSLEIGF